MRRYKVAGAILLGVGMLFLVASGAYYAYGAVARSKLDDLSYSAERPSIVVPDYAGEPVHDNATAATDESAPLRETGSSDMPGLAPGASIQEASWVEAQPDDDTSEAASVVVPPGEVDKVEDGWSAQGHDLELQLEGEAAVASVSSARTEKVGIGDAWSPAEGADGGDAGAATVDDASAGQASGADALILTEDDGNGLGIWDTSAGVTSSSMVEALTAEVPKDLPSASVELLNDPLPTTHISIPAINVDSAVEELEVLHPEDSYAWETPNRIVGHIPTTARPGGLGQGWYFGHLESPIKGEGNVFLLMPEIPRLLREGETVYVFLEADGRQYVYQVYRTEVLPREDLRITDSGERDITLVTCVPRYVYDHRLLVTAALVGVGES